MRRTAAAFVTSIVLLASLAGPTFAAASEHLRDHVAYVDCEAETAGDTFEAAAEVSETFGTFGFVDIWLSPDSPASTAPTAFAETSDVTTVEGEGTLDVTATYQLTNE